LGANVGTDYRKKRLSAQRPSVRVNTKSVARSGRTSS